MAHLTNQISRTDQADSHNVRLVGTGSSCSPIRVTENGLATADDTERIAYVQRARRGVASCLRDGIDVRGYLYWSALDNFEWVFGYRPTFGLIAVNHATQERTVKSSARWLGSVARSNGASLYSGEPA